MKKLVFLMSWGCLLLGACNKMDATYDKFIKDGPVTYTGKADSVQVFGGHNRVLVNWWISSDQTIRSCKVFWNFGQDSLRVPVMKTAGTDTVKAYVNNLAEGTYSFTVYTYDAAGHHSVGTNAIGQAYGDIFQSTLAGKPFRTATKNAADNSIRVIWVGKDAKCLGTEWHFTGTDQREHDYFAPQADTTFIDGCDLTKPVSYRSLYVPDQHAIDTFYTDYKSL
ncbi:DUF4998 domain-containing protein [Chitinophaga parva]|nr:DUF4998 domain-containing protein [Chitinophaga parva]